MKKKLLVAIITIVTVSTLLCGCDDNVEVAEVDSAIEDVVLSDSNLETENESIIENSSAEASEQISETEDSVETESSNNEIVSEAENESESESVSEATSAESQSVEEETKVEYTYTDMNKTMWAKSAVNVRNLPCTDGAKVGGLTSGEQVVVTGQCNETGWYRIGDGRYVSNSYLVSEKPQPQQTTPSGENNNQSGNTDASTTQGTATLLSSDFIGLLNAKRAEAGLSMVSLDGNLDATALAGVQELPNNYSHNVAGGGYDRCNIGKQYGMASASILFESWWNSEGHRKQMMDPYLTHIAVAYYSDGGYGIFIGNIDDDAYARDLAEQLNQGSTSTPTEQVSSNDVGGGQTVDTEITSGAGGNVTGDNWDDLGFESDPNSWNW